LIQQTTKPVPCQVRINTENPCLHQAVVELRGIPFCKSCAREQEAYFAIGELTWDAQDPSSELLGKTLGETLDGIRRQRADGLEDSPADGPAAARRLEISRA